MAVRTAVLGASGFAGSELLRLLEGHPETQVIAATSSSRVGESLETMYPHLTKLAGLRFVTIEDALSLGVDVVFSSLPHGESGKLLARYQGRVVDLAGDFRLREATSYEPWYGEPHPYPSALPEWVYGLSEFSRDKIAGALKVANPGCYPTAALLALGPLVAGQLVDASSIHIDAKSGVSGAGRAGGEGFDFSAMNENMRAYSPSGHKHIAEMEQELAVMAGDTVTITFIPHLVPLTRGLLVTCIAPVADGVDAGTLDRAMADAYASERFVRVVDGLPETKRLAGTNLAEVATHFDERSGKAFAFCAIDNLGKGAAGQAIQNMNIMLGFDEGLGLSSVGLIP